MADRLDVLLGILLDKAAQKDVERGIISIEQAVGKLDDAQLDKLALAFADVEKQTQELEERFAQTRQEAEQLNNISEKLARNSTLLFAAGTAVIAGAALAAQNYAKFVEDAGIQGDETADRWVAASKRVKNAQLNLGQASAQALLPVYEQLATLAEKVAGFANAHPELVSAAINTGVVVAAAGAIGLAVSKGIRLVADFKYLAATAEYSLATTRFQKSVHEFLAGSALGGTGGIGGGSKGLLAKGAAALAGTGLTSALGILASVLGGAAIGASINDARVARGGAGAYTNQFLTVGANSVAKNFLEPLARAIGFSAEEAEHKTLVFTAAIGKLTGAMDENSPLLQRLSESAKKSEQAVNDLDTGLRDFQQEANLAQATNAFIQYRQQEAQAEQQYMEQRAQIVEQGAAQLAQIEANYSQQRAQLARQFATSSAQAVSNFNYQQAQALEQFNRNEARALEEYNQNRQQAREDYQEAERQSEEDHRRAMQRMEEESLDRQRDLIAARDALGLVKEQRDLARQQRQAEEDFNVERARRRKEVRQRLQEMEEQFQAERARRREDFAYQQAQAAEQFARQQEQARQQYAERVKQLDEQHRQELSKARQQTVERLRELELGYRREQITRRNAFYDILRDLDANLLGEQDIRKQYYARMQQDLIDFLASTASSVNQGSNSNLPGYQSGGYTPDGAIRAHRGEWVANRETTDALERMVGGRLTQEGVRSLGGGGITINLTDQRRFDRMPGPWERQKMNQEIMETLEGLVS